MSAPSLNTTVALQWYVRRASLGGLSIPAARLRLQILLPVLASTAAPVAEWAWLDTAAPLSVIPFAVHRHGYAWHPIPGVQTTWLGQVCDVGTIDVWLTDRVSSAVRGPFAMLAKFPRSDPPGTPVPVLLGLHFVLAHQGEFHMPAYPTNGELRMS